MLKHLALSGTIALVSATSVSAQARSTVSGPELEGAVLHRTAERAGNRETVKNFLETDAARAAAARMGASTEVLTAKIGTLDEATINGLAQRVQANDLAGGADTIVISSTVIIIVLLIIILIAVA
jgi:hypothetical protein